MGQKKTSIAERLTMQERKRSGHDRNPKPLLCPRIGHLFGSFNVFSLGGVWQVLLESRLLVPLYMNERGNEASRARSSSLICGIDSLALFSSHSRHLAAAGTKGVCLFDLYMLATVHSLLNH